MTLDGLRHRQASAIAYELGDAPRIPDRIDGVQQPPTWVGHTSNRRPTGWMAALRFRCVDGHVGKAKLADGIRCTTCGKPAVLTFPEDTETTTWRTS